MESTDLSQLTKREHEVLAMVATGKCNKEIAEALHIHVATIQNHLQNLYKKLNVRNRTEASQKYWGIRMPKNS